MNCKRKATNSITDETQVKKPTSQCCHPRMFTSSFINLCTLIVSKNAFSDSSSNSFLLQGHYKSPITFSSSCQNSSHSSNAHFDTQRFKPALKIVPFVRGFQWYVYGWIIAAMGSASLHLPCYAVSGSDVLDLNLSLAYWPMLGLIRLGVLFLCLT